MWGTCTPCFTPAFTGALWPLCLPSTEPYGIAVHQDQSKLRNAINHQLLALWEDGTWQKIADTWFGPGAPFEHRLTFGITPYPK